MPACIFGVCMFRAPWPTDRRRIYRAWLRSHTQHCQQFLQDCIALAGMQVYLGDDGARVAQRQYDLACSVLCSLGRTPLPDQLMTVMIEYINALHLVMHKPERLRYVRGKLQHGYQLVVDLAQRATPSQLAWGFVRNARNERLGKFSKRIKS